MMGIKQTRVGTAEQILPKARPFMKSSLAKLMKRWHKRYIRQHFKPSATARYKYAKRTFLYNRRKRKKYGHNVPLVASGLARRQAVRHIATRGTSKSVRGTMQLPFYVKMIPTKRKAPIMGRELVAVARDEEVELTKFLDADMAARMNGVRDRKVVVVK